MTFSVIWLFLAVPWVGLQCVTVAFPDYTHLRFGVKLKGFKIFVLFDFCKSGNFRNNSIFAKNVKRHICHVINSRLGHDLPGLVNDREISPFCEGFIFAKLRT